MTPSRTLQALLARLRSGELTAVAATQGSLEAAEAERTAFNAYLRIHREAALHAAEQADQRLASGAAPGPLHGLPVAVKDNIAERGLPCPAGCAAYQGRVADADAEVVSRLRQAGAIVIGRTNMDELANGVTGDNPHHGPVANPWRAARHPGGSSGGAAVAVASGSAVTALGSDTGGSLRIPAALCGVVGFKPSRGLVPTAGVMPLSTTLDHVGPLARSVAGVQAVLEVLAPNDTPAARLESLAGVRVGVLEGFSLMPDEDVAVCFGAALDLLQEAGAELSSVTVPALSRGIALLARIYGREAALFHRQRLQEHPDGFGAVVRRDLERGLASDPARYHEALREMAELTRATATASRDVDLLVSPTTPHPARPLGAPDPHTYLSYTCPFNLTGQPALSLPMGLVDGLPVGLQVVAAPGADRELLAAARVIEDLLGGFRAPLLAAYG